tara:strand:- start:149 stop:625 length:477 start_codon:yes stop_codon:yes gene_type:complete
MKQTLKSILGIGAIALFFYILFSVLNFAQATPNTTPNTEPENGIPQIEEPKLYDLNRLILQQIPVYCGDTTFMFKTSAELMLESQILVGEVRQHGQPLGELLGILSFGHSVERDTGTFFMTIPGVGPGGESLTCILGFGTNWTFFNDDGSKIVIGNSL